MKAQSEATIQFSGYPLSIVEKKSTLKPELVIVKSINNQQTSLNNNAITNDPKNWDVDWFNGYE